MTAEIAEMLGLHPNTVRPHLDRMREVGLLDVTTDARGEVGRPQHRYSLAADAPSLGLEPPTMPVLARMVLAMAERLGASPTDAVAVGEAEGAARAGRYADAPSALEALVADLDRLGFDPVVGAPTSVDDARHAPSWRSPTARSPTSPATHPELVCGLHRGLVAGFVAHDGRARSAEFCPLVHRTPCQVSQSASR